ncbi:hypothetical protein C7S18_04645 [Ahniella affigens]|uniref:Uncharacterized protein n=1 Tax=Ahniella affigens TaxID=2021234 RepID=A0A2P1PNV8_9GAMM|nr:hypothetical protein [Ahniella affigens]AVP96530.1 hypothetical protein C7S18_04645 [Ahniella affigens]
MRVRHLLHAALALLINVLMGPAFATEFQPGQIVIVQHYGKPEEARVVRQDQYGVLVQWKDWQDGTFHDDLATAPTEYRQPAELSLPSAAAPKPASAPQPAAAPSAEPSTVTRPARPVSNPAARPITRPAGGFIGPATGQKPQADATAAQQPGAMTALPEGEYYCYTYHPNPVVAGVMTITGLSYRTRTGASGDYRLRGDGRVDWLGDAPLGFAVAVLEETDPRAKLRMYLSDADIGNKWKAAVCSPRDSDAADENPGQNGGPSAFAAGTKVRYSFLGYWYPATIVSCSASRCKLHYDDPQYQDETVDAKNVEAR